MLLDSAVQLHTLLHGGIQITIAKFAAKAKTVMEMAIALYELH